jgi:hypothetical protein
MPFSAEQIAVLAVRWSECQTGRAIAYFLLDICHREGFVVE